MPENAERYRRAGEVETQRRTCREHGPAHMAAKLAESEKRLEEMAREAIATAQERNRAEQSLARAQQEVVGYEMCLDVVEQRAANRIAMLENDKRCRERRVEDKQARLDAVNGVLTNNPDVEEALTIIARQGGPEDLCEDCSAPLADGERKCHHCGSVNPDPESDRQREGMGGFNPAGFNANQKEQK